MAYDCAISGRVEEDPSNAGKDEFWTFDDVQDRLIEAMQLWRRAPDQERAWLHVKALWPAIRRFNWTTAVGGEFDFPEEEPQPRALPLTRAEVASMTEASDWLVLVPQRDRKLVCLALARLAAGDKQVPWGRLKAAMGVEFGAHGLRKRYSRAITAIANDLNSRKSPKMACQAGC